MQPTNAGGIAVDVEKEADKERAVNKLNGIKNSADFSARIIPKKLPRVIVHGIPFEYLPEDFRNEIVKEYQDIDQLVTSADEIKTIHQVRFQRTRAAIGMDANAHNPLWNSTFTDDKGRELELRPIAISSTRSPECACCRACLGPSRNQFYRFYSCRG